MPSVSIVLQQTIAAVEEQIYKKISAHKRVFESTITGACGALSALLINSLFAINLAP